MTIKTLSEELANNPYPGRGIVAGRSEDGRHAVTAYFIMGRSANSRNRIFVPDGEGIRTQACDPSKMEDPGLIIYAPVRVLGTNTIVTNGDQTDTICQGRMEGKTFGEAPRKRTFEPDAPNYTPRISALLDVRGGEYEYRLSILKSADGDPSSCARFTFTYENPRAGEGHYLHTYLTDGDPLPSFEGEPERVDIRGEIDAFTKLIWENLNKENKISLFVRYIDIRTGRYETRIVNQYKAAVQDS